MAVASHVTRVNQLEFIFTNFGSAKTCLAVMKQVENEEKEAGNDPLEKNDHAYLK